jgi:predicted ATPase
MVPYFLALLARAELATGHSGAALKLLDEARARVERTGECWFAAEILRLEGEVNLTLGQDRLARARACFAQALETAAGQGARLWELRAALSLARIEAGDADLRRRLSRLRAAWVDGSDTLPEREAARALVPDAAVAAEAP